MAAAAPAAAAAATRALTNGAPGKWRPGSTSSSGELIMPCGLTAGELQEVTSTTNPALEDPVGLAQRAAIAALALPPGTPTLLAADAGAHLAHPGVNWVLDPASWLALRLKTAHFPAVKAAAASPCLSLH